MIYWVRDWVNRKNEKLEKLKKVFDNMVPFW